MDALALPDSRKGRGGMIVIYHGGGCVDGFTAAWCAWRKYGDAATYLPANYGDEPPDVKGEDVLVLDFSYPRETLLAMRDNARAYANGLATKLEQNASSVRVLDHHRTAEADLAGLDFCTFDMNRSGAGLAWDVLHGGQRPRLVDYVEDRDLWLWKRYESREISAWLSSLEPTFSRWEEASHEVSFDFPYCSLQGRAILRAQERRVHAATRQFMIREFGGHKHVPVINATEDISEKLGALAEQFGPFAVGWFQRADGKFVYSLRSRGDFDVSEIARQYGGGGHRNAAGFTVERLVHNG